MVIVPSCSNHCTDSHKNCHAYQEAEYLFLCQFQNKQTKIYETGAILSEIFKTGNFDASARSPIIRNSVQTYSSQVPTPNGTWKFRTWEDNVKRGHYIWKSQLPCRDPVLFIGNHVKEKWTARKPPVWFACISCEVRCTPSNSFRF